MVVDPGGPHGLTPGPRRQDHARARRSLGHESRGPRGCSPPGRDVRSALARNVPSVLNWGGPTSSPPSQDVKNARARVAACAGRRRPLEQRAEDPEESPAASSRTSTARALARASSRSCPEGGHPRARLPCHDVKNARAARAEAPPQTVNEIPRGPGSHRVSSRMSRRRSSPQPADEGVPEEPPVMVSKTTSGCKKRGPAPCIGQVGERGRSPLRTLGRTWFLVPPSGPPPARLRRGFSWRGGLALQGFPAYRVS